MSQDKDVKEKTGLSRRDFIKNTGLALGGIALGGGLVSAINPKKETRNDHSSHSDGSSIAYDQALMFFNQDQFAIVEAAAERIFPEDENGPGAKKLNVAYYIDHQLASGWGTGAKEYTQGPFYPGESTQGYQGHLNRQQLFEISLKGIEDYSLKTYKKSFKDLEAEEQDDVLTELSEGSLSFIGVNSAYFFNLLRTATLEGVYSDPLYGGNRNMEGWKMKNFPGHQMSFANIIESDKFHKIKPQGLNSQHKH
jgi:gluconate 2-dehydrogenase gamma chain